MTLILKAITFCIISGVLIPCMAHTQSLDTLKTGYLTDAAEEYWSLQDNQAINQVKHVPIRNNKGFVSNGVSLREGYDLFDDYLWGIGPQDHNGYFLQRLLLHSDLRWNNHFRVFGEIQSSIVSGRNGGPRPVQDQNALSILQLFGELSLNINNTSFRFRAGKQNLNYGQGTLLDLRDANVRRSFLGTKLKIERKNLNIDVFVMEPLIGKKGTFDDTPDKSQKIADFWGTQLLNRSLLNRLDFYYLWVSRDQNKFNEGVANEKRNTIGADFTLHQGNWYSYNEIDLQWGKFGSGNIFAWKIAPSVGYQIKAMPWSPIISVQGAASSGDHQAKDGDLQTFSPLYPKAIYYGFIDNAGSSNLVVLHPKLDLQIISTLKVTLGYYSFWRQQIADGIYAVNGAYLLPAVGNNKHVGNMQDISIIYNPSNHLNFQLITSLYQRGAYLRDQTPTKKDIFYIGLRTTFRI